MRESLIRNNLEGVKGEEAIWKSAYFNMQYMELQVKTLEK